MELVHSSTQSTGMAPFRARLRRLLASAVLVALVLLIIGSIGIGGVIMQRVVAPPTLHLHIGSWRVDSYTTEIPDCPPNQPYVSCTSGRLHAEQEFFVVWVRAAGTSDTGQRILLLPLR